MFAPAHKVEGQLAQPLNVAATTMTLDTNAANALANVLTGAFETYLLLDAGNTAKEVVRATAVTGNVVLIDRGLDGTIPMGFAVGTKVRYVLAALAFAELTAPPVTITTQSEVLSVVAQGNNKFALQLDPMYFYSPNSTVSFEQGTHNTGIAVDTSSLGCCPGDADPYY